MLVAKQVADLVTILRAFIAPILVWIGITQGSSGLAMAAWLMLVAWSADALDGPIARRSRVRYETWIGSHDLEVDMFVASGLLVYMLVADFVTLPVAGVYLLVWALVFWRWGVPRSLGMLVQAPIYAWFILNAIRGAPPAGWAIVIWCCLVTAITWPRFPKEVVPGFISGIRAVLSQYRGGTVG